MDTHRCDIPEADMGTLLRAELAWTTPGATNEARHADAHHDALGPQLGLFGSERFVVRELPGLLHETRIVPGVVSHLGRGGVGEFLRLNEIPLPDFAGIDAQFARAILDKPLDDEET